MSVLHFRAEEVLEMAEAIKEKGMGSRRFWGRPSRSNATPSPFTRTSKKWSLRDEGVLILSIIQGGGFRLTGEV